MKITLSDEDAERLGVGPVVEFDERRLSSLEAIQMSKATKWSLIRFTNAFGQVLRDDDGKPVMQRDASGEFVRDEAGGLIPVRDIETTALVLAVWLAVRRAGRDIAWKDFDINLIATDFEDEDEDDEQGKAPGGPTTTTKATSKR